MEKRVKKALVTIAIFFVAVAAVSVATALITNSLGATLLASYGTMIVGAIPTYWRINWSN